MAKHGKTKVELNKMNDIELIQKSSVEVANHPKLSFILFLILGITAFAFYYHTIFNEYALDDAMLITQNEFTLKGFDGIKDHLTHDFIYGFRHKEADDAASSHWRPLSLITVSVEIGLWGAGHPHRSHLFNVLLFVSIVLLLFYFLYQQLKIDKWVSFFSVLLFAIHPIHTEVVANIKGRDELMALFFVLLSVVFLWKFVTSKKFVFYPISVLLFFIALTAKEAPIVFCVGFPVILYFFTELKFPAIFKLTLGYILATGILFFIKNIYAPFENVEVSNELMNNPFLLATGFLEPLCTKIYVMLLYLQKLLYPYPLSFDYSYHQIQYKSMNDAMVYVSMLVYGLIAAVGLWQLKQKTILSFAIMMFFITISISSNLLVDIGMVMGERLMFVPSIFFMMILVVVGKMGIDFLNNKFRINKWIVTVLLIIPVFSVSAYITINRNLEWKDDITLNIADFKKCPNSARIANGAGTSYIQLSAQKNVSKSTKDSLLKQAIICFNQSLKIHPTFDDAFLNRGVAYSRIDSLSKAEADWDMVRQHANHPKFVEFNRFLALEYLKYGLACGNRRSLDSSINYLQKAVKYATANDSVTVECFYNLGGAFYTANKFEEAKIAFTKVMNLNPNFKDAKLGLAASDFALNKK
jgi:tetratricopeptide (TPR) repeat protein